MNTSRPGPIRRLIVGLWTAVDFSRRFVFNAIFLLLVVLLIAAIAASPGVKPMQNDTALVLELGGRLVEEFTRSPADRALSKALGEEDAIEFQLRDLLQVIEAAKNDARIDRIVLRSEGFQATGFAAMRELGAALRDFRDSGKQVVAFASGMEQKAYYLAAQADEIYLDPEGVVFLEGLGRYRMYYREGLQDKLGADVHLFKVGEFKSAAEPFVLDAASDEAREADLFWMNDLWQRFVADLAAAREIDAGELSAMIAAMPERVQAAGGDLAQLALDAGLVDQLMTAQQFEELMIERGALDEDEYSFRQIGFDAYLMQLRRQHLGPDQRPQVAVVVAQGEIVHGQPGPGIVGGESTSALLRQARDDENVKAVVLRVDSPGGGVFPSEQIRREVELIRDAGKPVVVSMAGVAASGGYWISMNADRIYADASTITGSIGVYVLWMSVPRVLEKIGVRSDGVGTTPLAGAFDPTRPFDPNIGTLIQSVIDKGYRDFTGRVAEARGSTPEAIDRVARGRVWSGQQALERGLVDELGGLRDALADAAERAELDDGSYGVSYMERPLSGFEKFLADMGSDARLHGVLRALGPGLLGVEREALQRAQDELRWLDRSARTPYRAVAHCLCAL
ncbi:MAG TPA: signal peptide peptidase SppA [Arenimonas sp.]|nr:signal peptide peptidase SppA [Arenimonas sp.]